MLVKAFYSVSTRHVLGSIEKSFRSESGRITLSYGMQYLCDAVFGIHLDSSDGLVAVLVRQ